MISLSGVSKKFLLPHERRNTLKEHFLNIFHPVEYEIFWALKDITLRVKKGEWVGIIGRNGSGKSTLLRVLAGILQPEEGDISLNGKVVPLLELGIGFHPELTTRQNILLGGTLLGIDSNVLRKEMNSLLEFAGLSDFQDMKFKNLSSGMRLRLAFSLVAQTRGDIFLLDEIFSVGDLDFQKKCETVFSSWKQQHKTAFFVSHDLEAVRSLCDRVVWLEKGRIKMEGTPSHILSQYES